MLKYRILAIRSKISYQAYIKKMTIIELFLSQINQTYGLLYETTMEYPDSLINKFGLLMSGDLSSVFRRLIEFELEHKLFIKKLQNGQWQGENQRIAFFETQKTLDAIKERDQRIVKDHLD